MGVQVRSLIGEYVGVRSIFDKMVVNLSLPICSMFDVQSFENQNNLKLDGFEKLKKKKIARSVNTLEIKYF